MKKNALQICTLVLCAALLALSIAQSARISALEERLDGGLERLAQQINSSGQDVTQRVEALLEEAESSVNSYALIPRGIDSEARTLLAEASVELKSWGGHTQAALLAAVGGEELSAPMESAGDGAYSAQLALPLEAGTELRLAVLISDGGQERREELGAWEDLAMLLPLQNGGGGWSGPEYIGGRLRSQFHITIEGYDGPPGAIEDPAFTVYKNGEPAQELAAVIDPMSGPPDAVCYTVDTENNDWSIECGAGDVIEIRFTCVDGYGLGYDFLFQRWSPGAEELDVAEDGGEALRLFWPEQ